MDDHTIISVVTPTSEYTEYIIRSEDNNSFVSFFIHFESRILNIYEIYCILVPHLRLYSLELGCFSMLSQIRYTICCAWTSHWAINTWTSVKISPSFLWECFCHDRVCFCVPIFSARTTILFATTLLLLKIIIVNTNDSFCRC